jgi:hypothetical protein
MKKVIAAAGKVKGPKGSGGMKMPKVKGVTLAAMSPSMPDRKGGKVRKP